MNRVDELQMDLSLTTTSLERMDLSSTPIVRRQSNRFMDHSEAKS